MSSSQLEDLPRFTTVPKLAELTGIGVDVFRDVRDKDLRGSERLFMAESELVLRRLLRRPDRLHALLLSPSKLRDLEDCLRDLPDDVPVYVADLDVMTQIAGFHIHRGVLATGRRPSARELSLDVALAPLREGERCTMVVAEGVTNVDSDARQEQRRNRNPVQSSDHRKRQPLQLARSRPRLLRHRGNAAAETNPVPESEGIARISLVMTASVRELPNGTCMSRSTIRGRRAPRRVPSARSCPRPRA